MAARDVQVKAMMPKKNILPRLLQSGWRGPLHLVCLTLSCGDCVEQSRSRGDVCVAPVEHLKVSHAGQDLSFLGSSFKGNHWQSQVFCPLPQRARPSLVSLRLPLPWPNTIWGGKGLFNSLFHSNSSSSKAVRQGLCRPGTWRQELMQRPWRVLLTGLLLMACSACSLTEPRTSRPGMATVGLAFPHQ